MQVSIAEIILIGGLFSKLLWEIFRNRQQDKDRERDRNDSAKRAQHLAVELVELRESNDKTHADLGEKIEALHSYVTNGVNHSGGGLAEKFVTRREYKADSRQPPAPQPGG